MNAIVVGIWIAAIVVAWVIYQRVSATEGRPEVLPSRSKPVDIVELSRDNWRHVNPAIRDRCVRYLREFIPQDIRRRWATKYANGTPMMELEGFFHLGPGMQIRNALRSILTDDKLPSVEQPGGEYARNWDDYYLAALHDLLVAELEDRS